MSQGEGDVKGSWNDGGDWIYMESPQPAVDGGDGSASVELSSKDQETFAQMKERTMSDPNANPKTGADLGSGSAVR